MMYFIIKRIINKTWLKFSGMTILLSGDYVQQKHLMLKIMFKHKACDIIVNFFPTNVLVKFIGKISKSKNQSK